MDLPSRDESRLARLQVEQLEDRAVPSVLDGFGVIGDSDSVTRAGNN
jgi:hypothetical protein